MKLYVRDKHSNEKIFLNITASNRRELARVIGNQWFTLNNYEYHVHEVVAESSNNTTVAGTVVGGLIGVLGGPVGVLIGGALGGVLGNESDKSESAIVNRFNQSLV